MKKACRIDNHNNDDHNNTMPRKNKDHTNYARILTTIFFAVILFSSSSVVFFPPQEVEADIADKKEIRIASWNLWNFDPEDGSSGNGRSYNEDVLQTMVNILTGSNYQGMQDYDVIFVQELMNKVTDVPIGFNKLCEKFPPASNYSCKHGVVPTLHPMYNTGNDEFFGIIYKNNLNVVVEWTGKDIVSPHIVQRHFTYNNDNSPEGQGMVRPPMKATVSIGDNKYQFIAFNNHLKPEAGFTKLELERLQTAIGYDSDNLDKSHNILVLGDLNADGHSPNNHLNNDLACGWSFLAGGFVANPTLFNFPDWKRIFGVSNYTNFAAAPCSYDKIIPNANMVHSYPVAPVIGIDYGIIGTLPPNDAGQSFGKLYPAPDQIENPNTYKINGKEISDHKLIWAKFNYGGVETTNSTGGMKSIFVYNNTNTESIFARGEGFVPDTWVDVYLTKYLFNNNFIGPEHTVSQGFFKEMDKSYELNDIRGFANTVQVNGTGHIENHLVWNPSIAGKYNLIVDVNRDGKFTNSIDVVDVFNQHGVSINLLNNIQPSSNKIQVTTNDEDDKKDYDVKIVHASKKQKTNGHGFVSGSQGDLYYQQGALVLSPENMETQLLDIQTTLIDVRGQPTPITIDSDGKFETEWNDPIPGAYALILDFDKNGEFDPAVDYRNHPNSIDFIVIADPDIAPQNPTTGIISTRGHTDECDILGCGDPWIVSPHTTTDYDKIGIIPGLTPNSTCQAETVVYVHGFQNSENGAIENFNLSKDSLALNDYNYPVIGFSWDSDLGWYEFDEANYIANLNGPKLAQFVKDFNAACTDTKIRLVGHSLGNRVVLTTIQKLHNDNWPGEVTSVHLLGAAVKWDVIGKNKAFGVAIEDKVGEFHNKFNKNDRILYWGLWGKYSPPLGVWGVEQGLVNIPINYFEQDVTKMIEYSYLHPSKTHTYNTGGTDEKKDGVMGILVKDWIKQSTNPVDVENLVEGHNFVTHVGDNYLEREVYNTGIANNIYTVAKELTPDQDVDIYTISERLLKLNNPGWDTWKSSSGVNLLDSAAPVFEFGEKVNTVHTSADESLYVSTWKNPIQIFDQPFINYYGKKYNVVIDVNRNQIFDAGDKVDTHDIDHMRNWFLTYSILDASADGDPAVSEYKEYLNDKLDLEVPLVATNTYDTATQLASYQYLCSAQLTAKLFKIIEAESEVGIRVLNEDEYYAGRDLDTGRHTYDQADFDGLNVNADNLAVLIAHNGLLNVDGANIEKDATLLVCADKIILDGYMIVDGEVCTYTSEAIINRNTSILTQLGSFFHIGFNREGPSGLDGMAPNRVKFIPHCK